MKIKLHIPTAPFEFVEIEMDNADIKTAIKTAKELKDQVIAEFSKKGGEIK